MGEGALRTFALASALPCSSHDDVSHGSQVPDAGVMLNARASQGDVRRLLLSPCRLSCWAQGDGEVKRREEQRRKQQAPTSTLFVVNFDVTRTRESDLAHEFNKYGRTKRVQIKKNFAFIQVSLSGLLVLAIY